MVGLKVFGQPASTDVARVLTCLFEKDLEFQLIRVDRFRREHKIPEYLQLHDPSGQVTFREGDLTLVDSRKIIRHLCSKYPDHGNKKLYNCLGAVSVCYLPV
ncbi:glutathione S-transferase F8 [Carex littledalei]|uniref:glutathione transferase n=1 Tax=Carex littledalei TaxID=544730 RepID=A0A833V2K9_9POAL|nr:glutathione S-transferase F8 [Carex littledalei]